MKYLHVNPLTNIEGKKKSFGKIMEWLALKLGLHSCLSNLKKKLKKKIFSDLKKKLFFGIVYNIAKYLALNLILDKHSLIKKDYINILQN